MPTSRATTSTVALSGGSSRATALSLNICPYRAICVFHRRPQVFASIGATTILTQGATRQDKKRIKELERDLLRKDRALAETAALLVLSKKVAVIFNRGEAE